MIRRSMSPTCNTGTDLDNPNSALNLVDLPDDVLYLIFSFCDVQSLGRLSKVCKSIYSLVITDCVWVVYSKHNTLIKDQINNWSRWQPLKERCRLSHNWVQAHSKECVLIRHNPKQLPWMQYDQTSRKLWVSTGNHIQSYRVRANGLLQEEGCRTLRGLKDDVSRFVIKGRNLVSGCRDGSICGWDCVTGRRLFHFGNIHRSDAQSVDFYDNLVVSGSRDTTIKVISTGRDDNNRRVCATLPAGDRIWSLAVSPNGSTFASGTAGCYEERPLALWDLNSCSAICSLGENHRRGAGILDIKYESPQMLLTCGYDTFLRLWDTRTESCVSQWEEPAFDSPIYCLQSDNNMTMVTGTARYGMTRLWDKRKTQPVQLYYVGEHNSPVYSLSFDSQHLYVALDLSINLVDFSGY